MTNKPIFNTVNVFIHDIKKNKIFAIRRSEKDKVFPGMIALPGGSIERREDIVTAAKREFLEETGFMTVIKTKQIVLRLITEMPEFIIRTDILFGSLKERISNIIDKDIAQVTWFSPIEFLNSLEKHNFPQNNITEFKKFIEEQGLRFEQT